MHLVSRSGAMVIKRSVSERATQAALRGLEYLVRVQNRNTEDACHGRFPCIQDIRSGHIAQWTTNWTTAVAVSALLVGYRHFGRKTFRQAASRGVEYIKSLQRFDPRRDRLSGIFAESTPQSPNAHPRDALTAAMALVEWHDTMGDPDALWRARAFADWFAGEGMEHGFPYWTVRFDDLPCFASQAYTIPFTVFNDSGLI